VKCAGKKLLKQNLRVYMQCYSSEYSDWLRAGQPRGCNSSTGRVKNFHFSTSSSTALGPTQSPIQWVSRGLFPQGIKRPWRETFKVPLTSV
jgi:hypothetical protein